MRIHYFQHVPFEGLDGIETWARDHGHPLTGTHLYADDHFPNIDDIDWLVIMGGPMNVYETAKCPWLTAEKRFIDQAIRANKTVLGICLGAQLIADVLGAPVFRNPHKEIGWFPVEFTQAAKDSFLFDFLPKKFMVFHWHGDTFALPSGAVHIASSAGCANQAFVYNQTVVGLQFHLEMSEASVRGFLPCCSNELVAGKYIQTAEEMLANSEFFATSHRALRQFLDRLAAVQVRPPTFLSDANRSREICP